MESNLAYAYAPYQAKHLNRLDLDHYKGKGKVKRIKVKVRLSTMISRLQTSVKLFLISVASPVPFSNWLKGVIALFYRH